MRCADGIRTGKEVLEYIVSYVTRTEYILSGSRIVGEIVYSSNDGGTSFSEQHTVIYLYDESGAPTGFKYQKQSYADGAKFKSR